MARHGHRLAAAQTCRGLQRTQLLTPKGFGGLGVTLLQPADVIAIAPARLGQCHAGVALQHFAEQPRIAPAVHQDVVVGVDQFMALFVGAHQHQAYQRRLGQVEPLAALGLLQIVQRQITLGHGPPVEHFDGQARMAVHHLARPFQLPLPEKTAAQHVMGLHRGVPGLLEAHHIQAINRDADLVDVVARRLFIQGVEQHALLHRRQGVDVFDGLGGQRQGFQLRLAQARQREIGGGHAAVARSAAMFHQRAELLGVGHAQGFDRRRVEHQRAEGPAQLQFTAIHLAIDSQPVGQGRIRALFSAGALIGRCEQRVRLVETAIDLAQVVEGDARHRQGTERLACGVVAQVAQRAEA